MWRPEGDANSAWIPNEEVRAPVRLRVLEGGAARARESLEQDLLSAFAYLSEPVAVVDTQARVVCMSRAAERYLETRNGICVEDAKLKGTFPGGTAAIAEALARGTAETVSIPSGIRRSVPMRIAPLGNGSRHLLVTFPASTAAAQLDAELVAQTYDLTPTEALIAVLLAEGASVGSIANTRGSSEQTVRTHLKRLLDKMGCRRQVELVRMLLSNPALQLR